MGPNDQEIAGGIEQGVIRRKAAIPGKAARSRLYIQLAGWQVRKIQAFLDERYDGPVGLPEAAAVIQRSPSYFARAFKATFGETLGAYVRSMRIEKAKCMLLMGDESLAVIALVCGFCDQAHMTRVFSTLVGLPPHRWRQEQCPPDLE